VLVGHLPTGAELLDTLVAPSQVDASARVLQLAFRDLRLILEDVEGLAAQDELWRMSFGATNSPPLFCPQDARWR
jgi:hypothetical protein